jgi:hypothetical protein
VRRIAIIAAGCAALGGLLAACGSSEAPETPTACLAPESAYLQALESAPDQVRLDGTTPISDCLVEEQDAGPLGQVGGAMVAAATGLNRRALRGDGEAATELGYLVGAAEQGAGDTGGIHRDLILRLESAATYAGPAGEGLDPEVQRDYDHGFSAGRATG